MGPVGLGCWGSCSLGGEPSAAQQQATNKILKQTAHGVPLRPQFNNVLRFKLVPALAICSTGSPSNLQSTAHAIFESIPSSI